MRYEWLATLESGCPNSKYWCELGFVLFVIGRCTHFYQLNCISICLTISRVQLSLFGEFDDRCLNLFCDI